MATYNLGNKSGAGDRINAFVDDHITYDTTALPTPRACASGTRNGGIVSVAIYVSGRSASRTGHMTVSATSGAGAQASPSGQSIGLDGSGANTLRRFTLDDYQMFTDASPSRRFRFDGSGSFWFARNSTGPGSVTGVTATGVSDSYDGSLAGSFVWVQAPTAPPAPSVTPVTASSGTAVDVSIDAPSDDGDTAVKGYRIQRATNSSFTTGLATTLVTTSGDITLTGLTPGTQYYFRATAYNNLTIAASELGGAWSPTTAVLMPTAAGLGEVWSGSAWVPGDGLIYNGSSWVEVDGLEWNGTAWVPIG